MIKLTSYSEQGLVQFLQSHKETQLNIKVNLQSHRDISYLKIIEDELSQLIHLTELSIIIPRYCVLSQRGYTHISNSIKHLTQLIKLSIKIEGFIQNEELLLLQNSISNLTHLQTLIFKVFPDNDLSSSTGQEFVDSLSSLSNLRKLTLQFLRIQKSQINEGNIYFWRGIQQLQNLEKLALEFQEQKYGWLDLIELFSHIIELKQLKHFSLILIDPNIPAFFVDMIISYVGKMIHLKSLEIDFKYDEVLLNDTQSLDLIKNLRNLKQLEKLKMKQFSRQVMRHHLKEYAELIGSLKYLKKLNMDCSSISLVRSLNWLGQSFLNLTNIISFELDLKQIQVYNEFISDLSISLQSMKNLRILKLVLSDLNNHQSVELGGCLSQLQNLTILFIDMKSIQNGQAGSFFLNSLNGTISINEFTLIIGSDFYYSNFYQNLHKLINLQTLEIPTINLLSDERLELLGQTFRNLNQLKVLSISLLITYQMNQKSVEQLESTFIELQSLESLNINLNIGRDNETITKINLLQHLKNLKKLNIHFGNQVLNVFDLSLSSLTNNYALEEAKVSANSMKSDIFLKMMDSLSSNFPNIKKLCLEGVIEDCSTEDSKQFSTICTKFSNLQILNVKKTQSSISFFLKGIKKLKALKKLALNSKARTIEEEEKLGKALQKLENLRKIDFNIDLNQIKNANFEKEYCKLLQYHQKKSIINYNSVCLELKNIVSFNEEFSEKEEDILSDAKNEIMFCEQKSLEDKLKEEHIVSDVQNEMIFSQQQTLEHKQTFSQKVVAKKLKLLPNNLQINIIKENEEAENQISFLINDNIGLQYLIDLEIIFKRGISGFKFPVNRFNMQLNQLRQLRYLNINLQDLILSEEQVSQFSNNSCNFKHLINLRNLKIQIDQINDHYCALLDQFKYFKELLTFQLETTISKRAANVLGNSLIELTNLEDCILDLCCHSKFGLLSILKGLKGLTNMQKLNLRCFSKEDNINGEDDDCDDGTELVSDFFVGKSKISSFMLNWRVDDNVKIKVPQLYSSLSQLPYLQKLEIYLSEFNSLNQEMLNQLINSINKLTHLILVKVEINLSIDNNNNKFNIEKCLSGYFNKQLDIPLFINYNKDSIELVQKFNFIFKIYSNLVDSSELDFLEELNEKKVVEFNFGEKKILTILDQIKRCAPYKLRLKEMIIQKAKDVNDICEFISSISNISMLQMNLIIDESIMDDSLTQIANSILQLKNLHTLCLIIMKKDNNNNNTHCTTETLLFVLQKIVKLQKIQELYLLTQNYYVGIPLQKSIKKRMKKLVKYEVNYNYKMENNFNI